MNDKKEITIPIEEYEELLKYEKYIDNWARYVVKCPKCGNLNPRRCICITCGDDCVVEDYDVEDYLEIREKIKLNRNEDNKETIM